MESTGVYTTKEVAEKLGKTVADIYPIKAKYKHLLGEDHCVLTKVCKNTVLLWSDLGLNKLKELFSEAKRQEELKLDNVSTWTTRRDLAVNLAITESKLSWYFDRVKGSLVLNIDYGYWQEKGKAKQQYWSKTGIAKLCEYIERIHQLKKKVSKKKVSNFTQSDFDKAIADLERKITKLKTKYPEFAKAETCKPVETVITEKVIKTIEGVKTKVLSPDYSVTKCHEVTESATKLVEPVQLTMAINNDKTDENPEETVFDRMRAFALENGIELKTMKVA